MGRRLPGEQYGTYHSSVFVYWLVRWFWGEARARHFWFHSRFLCSISIWIYFLINFPFHSVPGAQFGSTHKFQNPFAIWKYHISINIHFSSSSHRLTSDFFTSISESKLKSAEAGQMVSLLGLISITSTPLHCRIGGDCYGLCYPHANE